MLIIKLFKNICNLISENLKISKVLNFLIISLRAQKVEPDFSDPRVHYYDAALYSLSRINLL